jgi:O-acetyl-ADP-ribose deacetylase (regulator of RNase III)
MEFRVIQGDIAQQSADALVDAAGTSRRTGVAGALRRVGGEALNAAAVASGPVELGDVAGFELAEGTRIASRVAGEVRGGGE